MKSSRFTLHVLLLGVLLLVAWNALARRSGWRAKFADSDYQANRIRLESYFLDPPAPVILVGSSVTGRLDRSYFEKTQVPNVANLGLDGCVVSFSLAVAAERSLAGRCVVVEHYSLLLSSPGNEAATRQIFSPSNLVLPSWMGGFRADIRPTALIYSGLKQRRDMGGGSAGTKVLGVRKMSDLTPAELVQLENRKRSLSKIINQGARVVVMRMPYGEAEGPEVDREPDFVSAFAADLGVPEIDIPRRLRAKSIPLRYSDGLHLVESSARAASVVLAEELNGILH